MGNPETYYINQCKSAIEKQLAWPDSSQWKQRDYLNLIGLLNEKTGIALSLSTIRRIWKPDFGGTPHPSTLEALAKFLDYDTWLAFKKAHQSNTGIRKIRPKSTTIARILTALLSIGILTGIVLVFGWMKAPKETPSAGIVQYDPTSISFSCNNAVSVGVPNTVIFSYDVSEVKADSFFIQQSWNQFRRDRVSPTNSTLTSTYLEPGFHRAKLIANDSIIQETDVRVYTDDWLALVQAQEVDEMPIYIPAQQVIKDGRLQLTTQDLSHNKVPLTTSTKVAYYYVNEFDSLSSQSFALETRIRCDSILNLTCPFMALSILGEDDMHFIPIVAQGCIGELTVKVGEVIKKGQNNDLSAFGRNVYEWQLLKVSVQDQLASITLNDRLIYTIPFQQDIGAIVGFRLLFSGTGAIDYLQLSTPSNDQVIYQRDFET